jgi:hypothetical protein
MGFMILVMIVLSFMVSLGARKPVADKIIDEQEPEKIFVEKGFEDSIKVDTIEKYEKEADTLVVNELSLKQTEKPEEKIDYSPLTMEKPFVQEVKEPQSEDIESEFTQGSFEEPDIDESPYVFESDEDVKITPSPTFYEPVIEEPVERKVPSLEDSPVLPEEILEEAKIDDIEEIELPQLEPYELEQIPEEIEPKIVQETEQEPVEVAISEEPSRRIRKPIIDESDPDLQIDLGIETCPHCNSMVPATIYCINCGKALNSEDKLETEK